MPFIGLIPFLPLGVLAMLLQTSCFNALYRAYSISTLKLMRVQRKYLKCFNALYRAYSISTKRCESLQYGERNVSMPFIGLIPFLPLGVLAMLLQTSCFNALYRAYSISTLLNLCTSTPVHQVSMPFIGLIPFLHIHYSVRNGSICNVSMPFIGLIPFLQYLPETLAFCGFLSLFLQVFD